MNNSNKIAQLQQRIAPLAQQIEKLRVEETRQSNLRLVGKCFRYRNSYGFQCPGWWLYLRVYGLSECGTPLAFTFQHTATGRFETETAHVCFPSLEDRYESITPLECDEAWRKFQVDLARVAEDRGVS